MAACELISYLITTSKPLLFVLYLHYLDCLVFSLCHYFLTGISMVMDFPTVMS